MTKRKRRQFTPEFKAETVRLVRDRGKSVAEIARDLDPARLRIAARSWPHAIQRAASILRGAPSAAM